jgi:methionyl-tRNA formyltransferase
LLKKYFNDKIWGLGVRKLRVVFMGSPGFAVPALEKLVRDRYEVVVVYTQPDRPAGRGRTLLPPPVKVAAGELGLKVEQPETLKDKGIIARLAEYKPEVIVVCAYGQILPGAVLELPRYRCLNVHFSLLPRHRGASPVAATLLAGDEFAGVSVMIVTPQLDTGPVLARAAVTISPQDNTSTLAEKLGLVGADLLLEALTGWWRGEIEPQPQDESRATYFSQLRKEAGEIDWELPALTIQRQVRAFNPWPGCFTTWRGKQLKIIEAEALAQKSVTDAGRVIDLSGRGEKLGIGTGEGVLVVKKLQLEGKRTISAAEFLRGQRDFIGEKLPD